MYLHSPHYDSWYTLLTAGSSDHSAASGQYLDSNSMFDRAITCYVQLQAITSRVLHSLSPFLLDGIYKSWINGPWSNLWALHPLGSWCPPWIKWQQIHEKRNEMQCAIHLVHNSKPQHNTLTTDSCSKQVTQLYTGTSQAITEANVQN